MVVLFGKTIERNHDTMVFFTFRNVVNLDQWPIEFYS